MAMSILLFSMIIFSFPSPTSTTPLFPKEALPTRSGYLPITTSPSSSNSSIFFTFYEAQCSLASPSLTPLIVWLDGGPGCSSMLGNFFVIGPFFVSRRQPTLHPNPYSWNRLFGLLFLDNPIGTGFSVASSPSDIPRDQETISDHLYVALQSFLSSNPSFKSRPVYIAGESYAGKYVPALACHILRQQKYRAVSSDGRINLQGVAIGNGLIHPVTQVATNADMAYFAGLVNSRQRDRLVELQNVAVRLTREEKWMEATVARNKVLDWLQNATRIATLSDLTKKKPYESEMVSVFLNKEEVKEALGAAKELVWEECSDAVMGAMQEDVMKSVKFMMEELVREIRVLLYQGIFDLRDGVASSEAWMEEMEWEGIGRFLEAERRVWEVEGKVAGYVQRWGPLAHVVVSGAGHLAPADQGASTQVMIEDWVLENGLFGESSGQQAPMFERSYME
ncbi:serine carboxypeptidase-like 50 [Iris pallida]|uniref:Carboxypeptidase n=1 Tax=Iris pallida TaxID=29817 RepID=A0AAX6GW84_IRIPA|nr:serine carboxypeptidase-like 50 [Iris pallida]